MSYPPPYTLTTWHGRTVDHRSLYLLRQIERALGFELDCLQGSYSTTVELSGGTHDRGGVVDVSIYDPQGRNRADAIVTMFRKHGWAAWHRTPAQGPWGHHIHAVECGNERLSEAAAQQLVSYRNDDNGLAGTAPDDGPRIVLRPRVYPPLPTVSLENVRKQAQNGGKRITVGVRRVQRSLNARLDLELTIDGRFGPKTKAAYARWEKLIGGDGDGIPGQFSLAKLGEGRFKVRKS